MERKRLLRTRWLCCVIGMVTAATAVEGAPEAICVLASPSELAQPHWTYDGAAITLKGIARGGATEYRWDFGDGGGTPWTPIIDPYNLGESHTYNGLVGEGFVATLHVRDGLGEEDQDTFHAKIYEASDLSNPDHLDIRVNMSVHAGLWWLHKTMVRSTYGGGSPGYGQPYGYWNDPGGYPLPASCTSLGAFQLHGSKANSLDYDGDPYVETVQRALNYLLEHTYAFNISNQPAGDPDFDPPGDEPPNGIGLVINQSSSLTDGRQTYIGGICMTALASSGAPNVVASVGGAHVYDRTYAEIVQDMVDFFAWGQTDSGSGRGGWRYYGNYGSSDMSTAQWPPLGMVVAEQPPPRGMGAAVPPFVRDELIHFLNHTQHTACDNNHGGFGYDNNWQYMNCTKAGAGIICHEFLGTPLDDLEVQGAIGFLYRHWNDTGASWDYQRLLGNSYGMYGVMKAMRIPEELGLIEEPLPITEYDCTIPGQTSNSFDWYYAPSSESREGLAHYIVSTQHADGSWDDVPGPNRQYDAFCTGWRMLILLGVFVPGPEAVICDCDEQVYDWNQNIHLNGSCSSHSDPSRHIVLYEWDFDYDDTFVADATGVEATIVGGYSETGYYPVALRVMDDNPDPQTDIYVCEVYVHEPPHCPHAFAHPVPGGYYQGWVNDPVAFDASASWDPNDDICCWDWDWDNDGKYGLEDDDGLCFLVGQPDEFCYPLPDGVGKLAQLTWDRPYEGVIGVRVTDDGGVYEQCIEGDDESGDSDYDHRVVDIGNHPPFCHYGGVCHLGGPCDEHGGSYETVKDSTIVLDGSGSYDQDPGDMIMSFEWDLNGDGDFGDSTEEQPAFTVGPDVPVGTVYDVCLKVTDSFGEYSICCTIVTVIDNLPPECDANGPYMMECSGTTTTVALDGSESTDVDDDPLTCSWTTDCPGGVFDDATSVSPILSVDSIAPCPLTCTVTLTVSDGINDPVPCEPTTVAIVDTTSPTVVVVDAIDGVVDTDCEYLMPFRATVEDICCVDAGDVTVEVSLLTGNATLGTPTINIVQAGPQRVEVDGTVLVSDLTSCPATVRVTVEAFDCCGNPLVEAPVVTADVVDLIPPEIRCPDAITLERGDKLCNEDVQDWLDSTTATDNCDTDVDIVDDSADNGFDCGFPFDSVTTVTWTATDDCGNPSVCSSTITIKPAKRVDVSKKGSVLIYPKVEIKWDASGNVTQDTFISILNDYPAGVFVHWYFVNGDEPLDEVWAGDPPTPIERGHPGWNWINCTTHLTQNEPTYFSALTGLPAGCQPFTSLDDEGGVLGRPDPDGLVGSRVLRGYMVAYAVDNFGNEIMWNHLSGGATVVNYAHKAAWEYDAYAYQTTCHDLGDQPLDCTFFDTNGVCCTAVAIPGQLDADGFQYDISFDRLLLDFYAVGSDAFSGGGASVMVDTDLTLLPVMMDLTQDTPGPVTTKAHFDIWNENEDSFSGATHCVTCWDQTLLSQHGPTNYFGSNLQTDKGKARIDGLESTMCEGSENAPLLGVSWKVLAFSGATTARAYAGMTLVGQGEEAGYILADLVEPPDGLIEGDTAGSNERTLRSTWMPARK